MPTPITPTPGRMIWYQPHIELGLGAPDSEKPMAAVVAAINADGTINICTFSHSGNPLPIQGVPVIDPGDASTFPQELHPDEFLEQGGFAYWMPYQLQAAKVAAAASDAIATGVGAGGAKDPV